MSIIRPFISSMMIGGGLILFYESYFDSIVMMVGLIIILIGLDIRYLRDK